MFRSTTCPKLNSPLFLHRWIGRLATHLSVVLALFVGHAGMAQEAAVQRDPKAFFASKLEEYKNAVREIESLRTDFQSADAGTRERINARLAELVADTQRIVEELVDAGLAAYRAAPHENGEIEKMLYAVAHHRLVGRVLDQEGRYRDGGDQYETALPIVVALIEGGAQQPLLPVFGYICAYMTNDYEQAQEYLALAAERGSLIEPSTISDKIEREFMGMAHQWAVAMQQDRPLWEKEQAIREKEAQADDLPRVKLTTTQGEVVIELFENEAPIAVANFISLVKKGFYDGLTFHRVLPWFMAQGGSPDGSGADGPGYSIRCECSQPNHRKHFRGSLSMAHAGPNTGGSQFFLTFTPTRHLDGKHTVFGRVTTGLEVLGKLQLRDPNLGDPLPEPDRIVRAEVLRDRGHAYEFEKLPAR